MAKHYNPNSPATTNNSLTPSFHGDGNLTRGQKETIKKANQHATEIAGYAYKTEVGQDAIEHVATKGTDNHSDFVDHLQGLRDQERGKWAQRQNDAFTDDAATMHRQHQLGMIDAAGFKITETIEKDLAPDPKEPGLFDGWLGKKD